MNQNKNNFVSICNIKTKMPPEDGLPCYLEFQYWDKTNAEYKAIADAWIRYYQKCSRYYGERARQDAIKAKQNANKGSKK